MKKHKVILFNGLPGSGKLTIAELLSKKTGAKVLDNHLVNNLVFSVKEFEEVPEFIWDFIAQTKENLYKTLSRLEQTDDYILTSMLVKDDFDYNLATKFAKDLDAELIVINLVCNQEKILDRINNPERRNRKKLTDVEVYRRVIDEAYMFFPENSHTIDSTRQTPAETLDAVLQILDK